MSSEESPEVPRKKRPPRAAKPVLAPELRRNSASALPRKTQYESKPRSIEMADLAPLSPKASPKAARKVAEKRLKKSNSGSDESDTIKKSKSSGQLRHSADNMDATFTNKRHKDKRQEKEQGEKKKHHENHDKDHESAKITAKLGHSSKLKLVSSKSEVEKEKEKEHENDKHEERKKKDNHKHQHEDDKKGDTTDAEKHKKKGNEKKDEDKSDEKKSEEAKRDKRKNSEAKSEEQKKDKRKSAETSEEKKSEEAKRAKRKSSEGKSEEQKKDKRKSDESEEKKVHERKNSEGKSEEQKNNKRNSDDKSDERKGDKPRKSEEMKRDKRKNSEGKNDEPHREKRKSDEGKSEDKKVEHKSSKRRSDEKKHRRKSEEGKNEERKGEERKHRRSNEKSEQEEASEKGSRKKKDREEKKDGKPKRRRTTEDGIVSNSNGTNLTKNSNTAINAKSDSEESGEDESAKSSLSGSAVKLSREKLAKSGESLLAPINDAGEDEEGDTFGNAKQNAGVKGNMVIKTSMILVNVKKKNEGKATEKKRDEKKDKDKDKDNNTEVVRRHSKEEKKNGHKDKLEDSDNEKKARKHRKDGLEESIERSSDKKERRGSEPVNYVSNKKDKLEESEKGKKPRRESKEEKKEEHLNLKLSEKEKQNDDSRDKKVKDHSTAKKRLTGEKEHSKSKENNENNHEKHHDSKEKDEDKDKEKEKDKVKENDNANDNDNDALKQSKENGIVKTRTYDELPSEFRRKIEKLGVPKTTLEKEPDILWNIGVFMNRELFPKDDEKRKEDSKPYASPDAIEFAKSLLQTPTKPLKKLYKNPKLEGEGGFGSVFVAKHTVSKTYVAVKKLSHNTDREKRANFCEIAFLSKCKHANIVNFVSALITKDDNGVDEVWIIMEYLEGGTLSEAARAHRFADNHVAYVAREMLKALDYLHSLKIAHRDLKSSNVMMSITGQIKLIDFGLCADFSEGPRKKILGSPFWIPPEMIKNQPHSFTADIWSLGVCLLELFLMAPPHAISNIKCMFLVATEGLTSTIPKSCSDMAKSFFSMCLQIDPEKRGSAKELLKHPWVNQKNIEQGLVDILKRIFLSNSLGDLGF